MTSNKKRTLSILLLSAVLAASAAAASQGRPAAAPDYDVLIRNGQVYDGSLNPPRAADVAIKDGRIVRVGPNLSGSAARTIEAKGLAVMPGFIDMHTHADWAMRLPEERAALSFLTQGVTSFVAGQCGTSAWLDFEEAEDRIESWTREGIGPNAALLVGHGSVRRLAMGDDDREPTPEEMERMKALVRDAMEQGASGISTGLIYRPGVHSKTPELVELAKVIAPYGGIYHSHMRDERDKILEAIGELVEISEKAGVRAHISHFKVLGKTNWGLADEACRLVEEARARGLEITADQYPYPFSNTSPYSPLIPRQIWIAGSDDGIRNADIYRLFDGLRDRELIELYAKATPYAPLSERHLRFLDGLTRRQLVERVAEEVLGDRLSGPENERERALFLRRMADPARAAAVRDEMRAHIERYGPENILIGIAADKSLEGKSLREIASRWGTSPEETAIKLELMGAKAVPVIMSEADIEHIMRKDYVATGSDGIAPHYGIGLPHIRSYSTFLYKLGEYARRRGAVSLAHVIRSQTSLPAAIMRWDDRGWIKEGFAADVAILDLDAIRTPSSIINPHQYSRGVRYLLVNGALAIDGGRYTGALPGRVLKPKR